MTELLTANDLAVWRGQREVVRVERLTIEDRETLVVLGPNGAGKTTLVLALASLIPFRGELRFHGEIVREPIAYRRRIAVVLQRPLLLDRSVRENAALGLALRGVGRHDRDRRADAALARLGVAHLATRPASSLSGGEAQRVSIARALALDPEILFLDEPFAGLDAPARESAIADLARAVGDGGVTTVLVTHDRDEALSLADRVAVLIAGRIRQVDRAESLFVRPIDPEVAEFVGVENVLPARVQASDDEITRLVIADRVLEVTATPPAGELFPLVGIPPDDIVIARETPATSARNAFAGKIVRVEPIGRRVRVVLDCGFPLVAHITHRSATTPHLLARHRRAEISPLGSFAQGRSSRSSPLG